MLSLLALTVLIAAAATLYRPNAKRLLAFRTWINDSASHPEWKLAAGLFCLICENSAEGLPTLTRVSGLNAKTGIAMVNASTTTSIFPIGSLLTYSYLLHSIFSSDIESECL